MHDIVVVYQWLEGNRVVVLVNRDWNLQSVVDITRFSFGIVTR